MSEKERETERLQKDFEQQLETIQCALETVKGEKNSLQAQIVTVRNYSTYCDGSDNFNGYSYRFNSRIWSRRLVYRRALELSRNMPNSNSLT